MVSESQLELSICNALSRRGYFVIKLKDQSEMRNGSYRKGSSFQIRGVSDLVVYLDGGKTIWMEVKTAKGTLSEYQKTFSKRLEELGHTFTVVRSVEDAIGACKSFK